MIAPKREFTEPVEIVPRAWDPAPLLKSHRAPVVALGAPSAIFVAGAVVPRSASYQPAMPSLVPKPFGKAAADKSIGFVLALEVIAAVPVGSELKVEVLFPNVEVLPAVG